ncbi:MULTISPECIES: c-type cytochrome [Shewanella]|uniref:c-type cytochrome n=1 Tax=Shewanella TaxID=22 RepID=UPI000C5ABCAA|nr:MULTISPECIES: c-type cytochrome [Shewanella]NCQ45264.1 c-type cytochrome [Shewanella frigidimarina]NCO70748.1 c-type cytochrome [Shewanella vesiculosa]NCP36865.1 c-type cytochrome [Shewanella vesiculosa]NCP69042.1 c-type cytochrome [Shewanella vesiculosa]NCP74202.1 c-type cytochrome [Shewanella vesiculosa]
MKLLSLLSIGVLFSLPLQANEMLTEVPATASAALPDRQAALPAVPKKVGENYLQPASLTDIPAGVFGDKVRLGYQLFVNTQTLRDKYVGNQLSCANCHMNAGQQANSSPLWGAYFAYPAYRKKNDKVNSFQERVQGCFTYSMNGKAPESGSPELVAISAYSYWLGMSGLMAQYNVSGPVPELSDAELVKGAMRDDFPMPEAIAKNLDTKALSQLPGRGFPKAPDPELAYAPERGMIVYQAHCQTCHGEDGQGQIIAGVAALPPLWGPQSFNWGAGMHRVNTAADFIYENMPLGKSVPLTVQQAWDVAAYVNSFDRPQDPRFDGDVSKTQATYHQHQGYYGQSVAGKPILGTDSYPVFPLKNTVKP